MILRDTAATVGYDDLDRVMCISVHRYQLSYYRRQELRACHSICLLFDYMITTELCCALQVLKTPNSLLHFGLMTLLGSMVSHLNMTHVFKTECLSTYLITFLLFHP